MVCYLGFLDWGVVFRVQSLGVLYLGFRVWVWVLWDQGLWFRILSSGFGIWYSGFRVWDLVLRVQGLGFGFEGSGFGVWF